MNKSINTKHVTWRTSHTIKHLFLVGIFIWALLTVKKVSPKYDTTKTVSNLVSQYVINGHTFSVCCNKLFNGRICFHAKKVTSLMERICSSLGAPHEKRPLDHIDGTYQNHVLSMITI